MVALLDDGAVEQWLAAHPEWRRDGACIARQVDCASFPAAIELVGKVAEVAEDRDHHPDIDIRWRTLRFVLSTHSEGGLTEKDLDLASVIDDLASQAP
jgi:4a-hydroxytetrahydrobiopterin dehydratase